MSTRVDPRFIDLVVALRAKQGELLEHDSKKTRKELRELGDQVDKWLADYLTEIRKFEKWARVG